MPPPRAGSGRLPGGACVPPLLESWKHKVLLAGKYLNVIRECGIEVQKGPNPPSDDLAMDDERSVSRMRNVCVTRAYFEPEASTNSLKTTTHMQIARSFNFSYATKVSFRASTFSSVASLSPTRPTSPIFSTSPIQSCASHLRLRRL